MQRLISIIVGGCLSWVAAAQAKPFSDPAVTSAFFGFDTATSSLCVKDRGGSPQCVPFATLDSTSHRISPVFSGTTSLAPAANGMALVTNQTFSGTTSANVSGNYMEIIDGQKLSADGIFIGWNLAHRIGAGVTGHHGLSSWTVEFNGQDSGVTPYPYYTVFSPTLVVNASDGGTSSSVWEQARGLFMSMNPIVKAGLTSGTPAYNLGQINGAEINVACGSYCSTYYKAMLSLVSLADDKTRGTNTDAAMIISAQPGSVGIRRMIEISSANGASPLRSDSVVLAAYGDTALRGIDLTGIAAIGESAFSSPGFAVAGNGAITSSGLTTSGEIIQQAGLPATSMINSSASSNNRRWQSLVDSNGVWHLRTLSDNLDTAIDAITVARSGTAVTYATAPQVRSPSRISTGTVPTLSSSTSCTTASQAGGATAGKFALTSACTSGTITLTFQTAAAPNGWFCSASDITNGSIWATTGWTTTSATIFGSAASGHTVGFSCTGF